MVNFFRNHKRLLIVIAALVFFAAFIFLFGIPKKASNTSLKPGQAVWNGLIPGSSTKEDVISKLGQPVFETRNGSTTTDDYKSTSPTRNHQVIYNGDQSAFMKEIVSVNDTTTLTDLQKLYGQPEATLYGADAQNGYNLYVYLSKGVAYLGNPVSDTLLEIWYFPPTDLQTFISKWGTGYSTTIPVGF